MFAILAILDGIIVGTIIFYLIGFLFGDKPFVRLFKLLLSIVSGVAYICVAIYMSDVSLVTGLLIFLAPIGLVTIIWLKDYMYKNK